MAGGVGDRLGDRLDEAVAQAPRLLRYRVSLLGVWPCFLREQYVNDPDMKKAG